MFRVYVVYYNGNHKIGEWFAIALDNYTEAQAYSKKLETAQGAFYEQANAIRIAMDAYKMRTIIRS